jgi:hypothetical protein
MGLSATKTVSFFSSCFSSTGLATGLPMFCKLNVVFARAGSLEIAG